MRQQVPNHGDYLRPHEQTLAETLRSAGYRTGIFGKLHIGSAQADTPCNPGGMGFDEWVIGLSLSDTFQETVLPLGSGSPYFRHEVEGDRVMFVQFGGNEGIKVIMIEVSLGAFGKVFLMIGAGVVLHVIPGVE